MALRGELCTIVAEKGCLRLGEPVQLSSGAMSSDFVDGKLALAQGSDLALACRAIVELAERRSADFDCVGGITMGADMFSHGVAIVADRRWFVVRKAPKGRGTNRLVEGTDLGPGDRVLLVEDVISTGGSMLAALDAVSATGAEVVLATTLVDRGDAATAALEHAGVPYEPLLTYRDLGIDPVVPPPS